MIKNMAKGHLPGITGTNMRGTMITEKETVKGIKLFMMEESMSENG